MGIGVANTGSRQAFFINQLQHFCISRGIGLRQSLQSPNHTLTVSQVAQGQFTRHQRVRKHAPLDK